MLSYRHGFHAGGPADVLKHAVFAFVLHYAVGKPKAIYCLDTHAGAGAYDLRAPMALKLREHEAGIAQVLSGGGPLPELLHPYVDIVRAGNTPEVLSWYPGSPELARHILRRDDRLELADLHPTEQAALVAAFGRGRGARVTSADGLTLLASRLPPVERRAVVLVDPSYEIKTEYEAVPRALLAGYRRFPTGTYILWYPVLDRPRTGRMLAMLAESGMRRLLQIELCLAEDGDGRGMTGSGLVVINPPWTLSGAAGDALPWLAGVLGARGPRRCLWLVPE